MSIDVERIKKYNQSLKVHEAEAHRITAQLEVNTNQITSLCAELSETLGFEVNTTNCEQVYNELVSKINGTLTAGEQIMASIEQEKAELNNVAPQQPIMAQPMMQVQPVMQQPMQQVIAQQPVVMFEQPATMQQPMAQPVQQVMQQPIMADLPQMFGTI